MPNSYDNGRHTPDLRDDFSDCDPGFITVQDGRLGLWQYRDPDDEFDECEIHYRRNTRELASDSDIPNPRFKQRPL